MSPHWLARSGPAITNLDAQRTECLRARSLVRGPPAPHVPRLAGFGPGGARVDLFSLTKESLVR